MLLTPLPGGRDNLLNRLEHIRREFVDARGISPALSARHKAYLDAVGEGASMLRGVVRAADIGALLLSRRYWALVEMTVSRDEPDNVVNDLLSLELDDRLLELDDTISSTREALNRWSATAGHLVLPDTSFFLNNPRVLKNIDFPGILDTDDTITLLLPARSHRGARSSQASKGHRPLESTSRAGSSRSHREERALREVEGRPLQYAARAGRDLVRCPP